MEDKRNMITPQLLRDCGWDERSGFMVLRTEPRLGWNIRTHELVIGYAAVGVVESAARLRLLLRGLGLDNEAFKIQLQWIKI